MSWTRERLQNEMTKKGWLSTSRTGIWRKVSDNMNKGRFDLFKQIKNAGEMVNQWQAFADVEQVPSDEHYDKLTLFEE